VCLFGRFDVRVGERCIEEKTFSRQKTKTLLALLALAAGREVPRDKLASSLWQYSSIASARKNLYTIWSALRRNLELSRGVCPYLVRLQNGFKLDKRFMESDVQSVDVFCKAVLMGEVTERTWAPMLEQINEAYAGDLMPSETENEELARMRLAYRSQVVGALVAASNQLVKLRESRGALCYADEAYRRDHAREDVYVALMRAQIACNQRTQAMDTYFACRKFLAEELGIDPSAELVELYRSIIEEEASLD
jgi:DNA-binding SARP family transcriptional activator